MVWCHVGGEEAGRGGCGTGGVAERGVGAL